MAFRVAAAAIFLCSSFFNAQSKVYDRCELARELRDVHEIPEHQLATWMCIANYESHYNTSAHNPGSGDHGLFQISELYWCSPPGVGYACGLTCAELKDEDIEDDVICARRIYRQHQRMSGDGFTAWVVYNLHCKNPVHVASFLDGCFFEENLVNYGYQYEAMNLPTIRVPMPSTPFVTQKTTTTAKPRIQVSTYKPFPSSLQTKAFSTIKPKVSASPKPPSRSMYQTTPTRPSKATFKPTPKPASATNLFQTTPARPIKATFKPFSSSITTPLLRKFTTKPASRTTTPAKRLSVTTPKPLMTISTYKPFLHKLPSVASTYRTSAKPPSSYFTTKKQKFSSYSPTTFRPFAKFSSSSVFITPKPPSLVNPIEFNKATIVKPREIKTSLEPFNLKRDEKVYSYMNKSGYSLLITSNGFKFLRTES